MLALAISLTEITMKTIAYSATAARALRRYKSQATVIRMKIEQYAADPASSVANVKALKGVDAKRLRIGDFRVIFRETATTVEVLDLGPVAASMTETTSENINGPHRDQDAFR
jgi:mRNA interferase RelE/StbE